MSVTGNVLRLVSKRSEITHPSNPASWLLSILGAGWNTASGKSITPDIAKRVSAFYACVAILAETTACLPLITYKRRKDGGKERAENLDIYSILHDEPNPEQSPFEFREMLVGHVAMRGNFYARKEVDNAGRLTALWPIHPDRVRVYRNENKKIIYEYTPATGGPEKYVSDQIHHVRGPSSNGLTGDSLLWYMAEALGLSLASEEFGARFFANDATPSGVLQKEGRLSDPAYARLQADLANRQGAGQAHRHMILEEGLKWQQIGITARDAQLLELRRFSVSDIARFFRIPLHMLQETDKATSWGSGIESMGIAFVVYTLMPWLVRIEQASERDLLTPTERKRHYIKFVVKGLLRGDSAARGEFYSKMMQIGAYSQNDVLELEDEDPFDGGDGHYIQVNMQRIDGPPLPKEPAVPVGSGE